MKKPIEPHIKRLVVQIWKMGYSQNVIKKAVNTGEAQVSEQKIRDVLEESGCKRSRAESTKLRLKNVGPLVSGSNIDYNGIRLDAEEKLRTTKAQRKAFDQ